MTSVSPAGFKTTELAPLPEEWEVVRLGDVATFTRKPRELQISAYDVVPFIPMELIPETGIFINQYVLKSGNSIRSGTYCEKGDILLARITPSFENGKQGIVGEIPLNFAYATTEVYPIRAQSNHLDQMFLFFFLRLPSVRSNIAGRMEGSTGRQRVPKAVIENYLIPLPPLPEQRRIAYVLRTIQQAKEATERVIAALKELKKSLMRHLFTYGPVPLAYAEQVPLKETEIGPVPEHWEVVRLGEVTVKTEQINPRKTPDWRFKYVDVSSISRERLCIQCYKEYKGKEAPSRARKMIKAGDVLFATVRPYLKRVAMVPSELDGHICSTAFCVIRAAPDIADSALLFFAVSDNGFVQRISEYQRGTNYPAVTDSDVLNEFIPLPPLPEQREIARILQAVDRRIEAEEQRKSALEALFKTMLHLLMTGQIRLKYAFVQR